MHSSAECAARDRQRGQQAVFQSYRQRSISEHVLWAVLRLSSTPALLLPKGLLLPHMLIVKGDFLPHSVNGMQGWRPQSRDMMVRASWVVMCCTPSFFTDFFFFFFVVNRDKLSRSYDPVYSCVKWWYWQFLVATLSSVWLFEGCLQILAWI